MRPRFRPPEVTLQRKPVRFSPPAPRFERPPVRLQPPKFVRVERSALPNPGAFKIDPYVDYERSLTDEGGILLTYKDIDESLIHTLRRLFLWSVATGFEAWFVAHHSPVASHLVNILCLAAAAIVNWLIVAAPVEIYRTIEIRPDCMILDGRDLFWSRYMETGWPSFQVGASDTRVLTGIYGTRQVEYLTVRRFDEADPAPELLAAHLQDAMRQLWQPFQ